MLSASCSHWPFEGEGERAPDAAGGRASAAKAQQAEPASALSPGAGVAAGDADDAGTTKARLEGQTFTNSEEFYKWFSEVESLYLRETESKFTEYASCLREHSDGLAGILRQIDDALQQYEHLKLQQLKVRAKTQSVQGTCERLAREREQLEEFAQAVKSKLRFFDELESIANQIQLSEQALASAQLPSATSSSSGRAGAGGLTAEDYIDSLGKIDDCISFLAQNSQYLESGAYLAKYRALQHKALSSVRQFVCAAFSKAAQEVIGAQQRAQQAKGAMAAGGSKAGLETALLYVKFKAAVPDLQKVVGAIQMRLSRQDYSRLMHEIQRFYSEKRIEVLGESVEEHLLQYQGANELPMLIRLGSAYVIFYSPLPALSLFR